MPSLTSPRLLLAAVAGLLLGLLALTAQAQVTPYCQSCEIMMPRGCSPPPHCPPAVLRVTETVPVVQPRLSTTVLDSPVVETQADPYDQTWIHRPPPHPQPPQAIHIAPPMPPGPPEPPIEIEVPGPGHFAARSAGPDPIVILPGSGGAGMARETSGGPLIIDATSAGYVAQGALGGVTVVPPAAPSIVDTLVESGARVEAMPRVAAGQGMQVLPEAQPGQVYVTGGEQYPPQQQLHPQQQFAAGGQSPQHDILLRQQQTQVGLMPPLEDQTHFREIQQQQQPVGAGVGAGVGATDPASQLGASLLFLDSLQRMMVPSQTRQMCPESEFNWTMVPLAAQPQQPQQPGQPQGSERLGDYTIKVFAPEPQFPGGQQQQGQLPQGIQQIKVSYKLNPKAPQDFDTQARSLYWSETREMQRPDQSGAGQPGRPGQPGAPVPPQQPQQPGQPQQPQQQPPGVGGPVDQPELANAEFRPAPLAPLPDGQIAIQTQAQTQAQGQGQGATTPGAPGAPTAPGVPPQQPGQPQQPDVTLPEQPQQPGLPQQPQQPQQPGIPQQPQQPQQPGLPPTPGAGSSSRALFELPLTGLDLHRGDELFLRFEVRGFSGCSAHTPIYRVRA